MTGIALGGVFGGRLLLVLVEDERVDLGPGLDGSVQRVQAKARLLAAV